LLLKPDFNKRSLTFVAMFLGMPLIKNKNTLELNVTSIYLRMKTTSNKELSSNWWRLFGFFVIWLLICAIFYAIIILPFYPDSLQLSHEQFEKMHIEDTWFSLLIQLTILLGTLVSFWYMKEKVENISVRNFYRINFLKFYQGGLIGFFSVSICSLVMLTFNLISFTFLTFTEVPILILIYAMVAISEEVVCRGYLLNNLMEKMPKNLAIILSSLIFSFMHFGNSYFGIIGFVNIFLAGILMAILYLQTKDLSIAIGLHFAWNLTQSVLGFAVSGQTEKGLFALNYLSFSENLTGGKFGLEGSILLTPIIITSIFLIVKRSYFAMPKNT